MPARARARARSQLLYPSVHVNLCTYASMCVSMRHIIFICVCLYVWMHACLCVRMYVCVHAYMLAHGCMHVFVCARARAYASTHVYTSIHLYRSVGMYSTLAYFLSKFLMNLAYLAKNWPQAYFYYDFLISNRFFDYQRYSLTLWFIFSISFLKSVYL